MHQVNFSFIKKYVVSTLLIFAAGIVSAVIMLTLVYFIPDSAIAANRDRSLKMLIEDEHGKGTWELLFTHGWSGKLDTDSDINIFNITKAKPEYNAIQNAMYIGGYSRYWHGYMITSPCAGLFWIGADQIFFDCDICTNNMGNDIKNK